MGKIKKILLVISSIIVGFSIIVSLLSLYYQNNREEVNLVNNSDIKDSVIREDTDASKTVKNIEKTTEKRIAETNQNSNKSNDSNNQTFDTSNNRNLENDSGASSVNNDIDGKTTSDYTDVELEKEENSIIDSNESTVDMIQNKNDDITTQESTESNTTKHLEIVNDKKKIPDDGVVLYAEDVDAGAGDSNVRVDLIIKNNPGILGMTLTVYFDESELRLVKITNGDAFSNVLTLTESNELTNGLNLMWDGQDLDESNINDGVIAELLFDVDKEASFGKHQISIVCDDGDVVDKDLNNVDLTILSGTITIKE